MRAGPKQDILPDAKECAVVTVSSWLCNDNDKISRYSASVPGLPCRTNCYLGANLRMGQAIPARNEIPCVARCLEDSSKYALKFSGIGPILDLMPVAYTPRGGATDANSGMHPRCVPPSGAAALRRGMGRPRHNCP